MPRRSSDHPAFGSTTIDEMRTGLVNPAPLTVTAMVASRRELSKTPTIAMMPIDSTSAAIISSSSVKPLSSRTSRPGIRARSAIKVPHVDAVVVDGALGVAALQPALGGDLDVDCDIRDVPASVLGVGEDGRAAGRRRVGEV